jgi:UDP-MurNAc hydroxylase
MKVRYLYSACVVIQTRDLTLGCDPWFTPGIYDGAWFHYPPIVGDAVELLGKLDAIYVSHIDPDHYDSRFLKRYLRRYPATDLFIGHTRPPYLLQSMKRDGFNPTVLTSKTFGRTEVHIFPNHAYETDNVDTALVVTRDALSTANMNDNPYDQEQVDAVLSVCPERRPTFALLPYAGAGPYPQTYVFEREEAREVSAQKKKRQFLTLYSRYVESLKPLRAMPFAGKYVLGGPLAALNEHRGLADATVMFRSS